MSPWRWEVRLVFRSMRGRAVWVLTTFLGLLAASLGAGVAKQHQRLGQRDAQAALARIQTLALRGRADAPGENALAPQSALELSLWQDTLIARGVGAASGFVAASLDNLPDAAAVRLYEPPRAVPSRAERSPAAALLGVFDPAWLLGLILPILAILLGYERLGRERAQGTLAMLLQPAVSSRGLVLGRVVGAAVLLAAGVVPAMAAALLFSAAALGSFSVASMAALPLSGAYVAFWAALVVWASVVMRRPSWSLAFLLGAWLLAAFVWPVGTATLARGLYPDPDPRDRLLGEQVAAEVMSQPSVSLVAQGVQGDPELDPEGGADGPSADARQNFLLAQIRRQRAEAALYSTERAMRQRAELVGLLSYLSPVSATSEALAALSGASRLERFEFRSDAEAYRGQVERLVRSEVIANQGALADPGLWPRLARQPASDFKPALVVTLALLLLALVLTLHASWTLDHGALAPERGEG